MDKVRRTAVELLTRVASDGAYSTAAFQQVLAKEAFDARDKALLTELFYGTIQRQLTLDYYLAAFVKKLDKLERWVLALLRLSVYQLVYLDKVPDHAVIYEAVQIAKKKGHAGIAKLVNGVLRNIQRQGVPDPSLIPDDMERMSVMYSLPAWLVELLVSQYGVSETQAMATSLLEAPHLSVRVQRLDMSASDVVAQLASEGVQARLSEVSPRSLIIESGDWLQSKAFRDGLITVQDESSALVAQVASLSPSDRVLDTCAAPGGKTTHLASYLDAAQGGRVVALDLHANKLRKIRENASRLHVDDRLEVHALDARRVATQFEKESFDVVLVDAPCSGLGLMRRKPEIKYTKTLADLESLTHIQQEILVAASEMVKPGGTLVYSTCTINQTENDRVVAAFLECHPDFRVVPLPEYGKRGGDTVTILPQDYHSDGFYICRLQRTII